MNIKAIVASLVLGSSSLAMAAPSVTVSATVRGSYGTPVVRDHRNDDDRYTPVAIQPAPDPTYHRNDWNGGGRRLPPVYRPQTLASGLNFANVGQREINVGGPYQFGTLQIGAAGGRTFIRQVYIQFSDGREQVVRNVNTTLAANQNLTLDLDGGRRNIHRVIVYGKDVNAGWRRSPGTFTVTAS